MRKVLWIAGGVVAFVALVVIAVQVLLANIDAGFVKRRVQAAAHDKAGIELDYGAAHASLFSGLLLHDLSLPDIGTVREVRVRWSLLPFTIREVAVRGVAVVTDADALKRWNERRIAIVGPPPPSGPLSHVLDAAIDGSRLSVEKIEISDVTVAFGKIRAAALSLNGRAAIGGGALDASLESAKQDLVVTDEQGRKLVVTPSLSVRARGRDVAANVDAIVHEHSLAPSLPEGSLLSLAAALKLQPAQSMTGVRVEKLSLVDGLVNASAELELPDKGAPILYAANAKADLDALAQKLRDLVPAGTKLGSGALALDVSPAPGRETRFPGVPVIVAAGRALNLDLDVRGVATPKARVQQAKLTARAADAQALVDLRAKGVAASGTEVDEVSAHATVVPQPDGRLAVRATMPIGSVTGRGFSARKIEAGVDGIATSAGAFDGKITVAAAEARSGVNRLSGISLAANTRVEGDRLGATTADVQIARVATPKLATPAHVELKLEPMDLNSQDAIAQVQLAAGPLQLHADVARNGNEIQFDAQARAEKLGPFAAYLPPGFRDAGLALQSKGSLRGQLVDQKTHLEVQGVQVQREGLDFASKALTLDLTSRGTQRRHVFDATIALASPQLNGKGGEGKQDVAMKGAWDLDNPRLDLHVKGSGVLGLDGALDLIARYENRAVTWRLDGKFTHLGLLAVAAPKGVDFEQLGLEAHGSGKLTSLVKSYKFPQVELETDAFTAIRGGNTLDVTVTGLDYSGANDVKARVQKLALNVRSQTEEDRVHAEASLEVPSAQGQAAGHKFAADDVRSSVVIDTEGDQATGAATMLVALRAGQVKQDAAPTYPIGDVDFGVTALADTKGAIRIDEAHLENPRGGTSLTLHGGVDSRPLVVRFNLREARKALAKVRDWIPGRRNLLIEGQLVQKLGAVLEKSSGSVTVPFRVESGNLSYVRATAGMRFEDVSVSTANGSVEGLNGFVPVTQDFLLDEKGVQPVFGATTSPWARLRFADQQPFTSGSPFVTARKVSSAATGDLGPLAGNVRIDRNLVAIDQLEAELPRGGKVTGQVLIDYEGDATQVGFRGAVTGLVTEGSDERLDANCALTLRPFERLLDGRIELVRLGRSHLLKLLDLYDPYQANVAANKMRLALKIGYPKRVRLGFENGFASLAVELGGVAGLVRIDEIRGTPVGPVLERYLRKEKP